MENDHATPDALKSAAEATERWLKGEPGDEEPFSLPSHATRPSLAELTAQGHRAWDHAHHKGMYRKG